MLKRTKVALVLICTLIMVLTGIGMPVASAATTVDSLTVGNLFDSLGEATQYGVVAREWDQGGHAETNACVDVLDRHVNTVFSNTDSTYFHALGYQLTADVTAPQSLKGMTFALFKESEDGTGFVRIDGTDFIVDQDVNTATLLWNIGDPDSETLKELKNTRLYVMQVKDDGSYVPEAGRNDANLVVNYGPSISASAYNSNYIGKIYYENGSVPDSVGIFNTTGNTPGIVLGAATRLYYQNSAGEYVQFDPEDTTIDTQYVMVNVYYGEPEQMTYAKLDGISVKDGVFTKNGDVIKISYSDETSRAADLLEDAEAYSKYLGNIGGGEITSLTPNPEGSSTVHGPVAEDGSVLSLYDVEVGADGVFKVKDDMGWDGIPVAPNEYVVINLICPSKDGEVSVGPGAMDITYFYEEGQDRGEQVQWGSEDSNSSQRVIFNFVYADENGVMQPFEGTITPHSRHGGTLLAPKANVSVTGEVHNGSIIADSVYNSQEIHQRSLSAGTRTTWVRMNGGYVTLQKASLGYDWTIPPYGEWVDMSDKADLSGAVFGIYSDESCSEDSLVGTMETGEDGVATSGLISAGTYWIKELVPLKDHNLETRVIEVTITAGQTVQAVGGGYVVEHEGHFDYSNPYVPVWVPGYTETVVDASKFVNQQNNGYTSLRLLKHDEFGDELQGATFGVYSRYDRGYPGPNRYTYTLVASGTTNRNGVTIIEKVPLSYQNVTYYIREISAPDGYRVGSNEYIEITLTPDDRDKIITIDGNDNAEGIAFVNNVIRGNMALKKVDAKTNANLEGAEFTIYSDKACTQVVGVMTTKKGGDADSKKAIEGKDGLVSGTYYVKETKAPDGYMADDTVYTVNVVADKMVDVVTGEIIPGPAEATGIPNSQAIHLYGTKVWYDEGYENNRPNEVKVALYKGDQFLREVTVSAQTDWKFEFLNLPRYDEDGNEIEYSVRENLAGKSYDYYAYVDGIDGSGNVNIVVANSIRRVEITGEKAWEDTVGYDPERPDQITFLLYQEVDGELVPMLDDQDRHMTTTGGMWDGYKFKFENLPFYDATGAEATYVVKEAESGKYLLVDTTVTETEEQNRVKLHFTLTNRLTVPLAGTKVWQDSSDYQGRRPENVTLVVYCNGARMDPQPEIVWDKETDADVWAWSVDHLPKYDANNNLNTYTVKEEPVPAGYVGSVSEDGLTFYNTIYGEIRLYKVYVDRNGNYQVLNGAEFMLYYDEACQNPVSDEVYVTSNVSNTRNGFIQILNLVPGDYYILETKAPTGFVLPIPNDPIKVTVVAGEVARANGDHGVVINVPNSEAVTIKVDKTWVGDEGKEDARPQSVTIQLYQNGTAMDGRTLEMNAANNWSGEFTKLPNLDDGGNPYTYTVKETAVVPGYVGTVTGSVEDGFTVTNTYNNTEITVTKKWEGPVSADDMGEVEVWLLANGWLEAFVYLNVDNNWTHTFENLPIVDETGAEIDYSVFENTKPADFSVTYTGDKDSGFVVTNTAKVGKITLTKVDAESGKVLKGAKFGIYSDEGCQTLVEEITTGDDGKATSGDLLPGTYYVKETEAPAGYKIVKTDAVAVTVVGDQTVQAIGDGEGGAFTNTQGKGKLYVKKVGTDKNGGNAAPLAGAEFTVYQYINGQKTEVGKIITDENGYGEVELPIGDYMVQETKAPDGYKINDSSEKWVSIRSVDEEVWVKGGFNYNNEYGWFQNTSTAMGSIKLTKVSAKDESVKLAGAVFGVYSDQNCNNKVGEMTTDENGVATYANLEANTTYYIKEITAPAGYELNTQVYSVLVAANTETEVNDGNPIPNEAEREKGAIKLTKVSAVDANTKLKGAEFTIYSDEDCTTEVGKMTTNDNGEATYEGLYAGETYWLKETKAPSGYVLSDAKYSVTVVATTTTAVNNGYAIPNEESEGVASIYLYKVATDTSGNTVTGWLAGAEFDVYNVVNWNKGEKIGSMTTDASGLAEFTVPAVGTYIVVETKAPAGYERDNNEQWVTVYNEGDRVQVTDKAYYSYNGIQNCIGNKKQATAYLELYKLGAEYDAEGNAIYSTLELLDGAEFTVTADDGSIDPIVIVTENGYAKVEVPVRKNLTIEETKAPEGYEVTQGAKRGIWINNDNETVTLSWWGTDLQTSTGSKYIYYESNLANSGALINKKIKVKTGEITFGGTKTLEGKTLEADAFSFVLKDSEGNAIETVTNAADGSFAFTKLEYTPDDVGKNFSYTVTEVAGDAAGVTYDKTEYTVNVTVADNGGDTLTVTADIDHTALNFTNKYEAKGDITFAGTKSIDGRKMTDKDIYTFEIKEGDKVIATVSNDATGAISYPKLEYTLDDVGTHTYKVKETGTGSNGITIDATEYTVTVTVSDNGDGTLSVTADIDHTVLNFVNKYEAKGDITFEGTKRIEGRAMTDKDIYTFEMVETDAEGKVIKNWNFANDATGKIVYPKLEYTLSDVGTHTYKVKETSTNGNGITVDGSEYTVIVTVTDNGDGTLSVTTAEDATVLSFTNTYHAEGDITFAGTKSIEGRAMTTADVFNFEMVETDAEGTIINTWNIKNDATGKIAYPTLNYTLENVGIHTYTVTETSYNITGIIVDTRDYTVTVNVADNGDGTLSVTTDIDHTALNFVNKIVKTSVSVTKKWVGDEQSNRPESIEVALLANGKAHLDAAGKPVVLTLNAANNWSGSFTDLPKYDGNTEITYTVQEVEVEGYVSQVKPGETENSYVITNTFKKGEAKLYFNKMVLFSDVMTPPAEGYTFTFSMTPDANTPDTYTLVDVASAPEDAISITPVEENGKVVSYTLEKTLNSSEATDNLQAWSYLKLTFTAPGTYIFTLQEIVPETIPEGWYYDTTPHTFKFVVTDGEDKLEVERQDESGDPTIRNKLMTEEVDIIKYWKDSGYEADRPNKSELPGYLYVRYSADDGKTWTEYGKITDLQAEKNIVVDIQDRDDSLWHVSIKKLPDYIGGKDVQWSVVEKLPEGSPYETGYGFGSDFDPSAGLTGTDSYNTTIFNIHEVEMTFEGNKTMTGRALTGDEIFTFEIAEIGTDNSWPAQNDATGKINFPTFTYGLADIGEHKYTVKETTVKANGVTSDPTVYEVYVKVSLVYGQLVLETHSNCTALDFVNTYAAEGEITFAGVKTLEGKKLEADMFSFEVCEEGSYIAEAHNDATGKINYPTITYTQYDVGEHTYIIREISEDGNGITVDTTEYTVKVTVSDNGDGTLKVEAAGDDYTKLDFANTYEAEGNITFAGTKTLEGRETTVEDVFTFEIREGDKLIAEANNGGEMIYFPTIKYTQADVGEHIYTVRETSADGNGITVDDTIYEVIVTVSDNGDGTLKVETTGDDYTKLDFVNTYEAKGEVQFAGVKTLIGRELEDGEFTFELLDDEDNVLDSVTNTADGSYEFITLYYDQDDIGEHIYHVREVNDGKGGVTYDDRSYDIEVVVSDNRDGTLEITTNCSNRGLDFVNYYAAEGEVQFAGSKTLTGKALAEGDFSFQLIDFDGTVIETVTNDANGEFAFSAIKFTQDDFGPYTYKVKEVNDELPGVTYDPTEYTVTVTVEDNGDGTMNLTTDIDHTELNFVNKYEAAGGIELEGTKTLVGRELAAGEFEFELVNEAGETVATATNDAGGKIVFTKLTYTTEDIGKTYTYTAKEAAGNAAGVKYDSNLITVKVKITDNGDGTLNVTTASDSQKIAFTNTYSAEGAIILAGTKSLSGRALKAGEFSFELYDAAGTKLQTATNDANGAFAFEEIKYALTDAGKEFTYTVKEAAGDVAGVTYDENVITVKVQVTDVGGKLSATLAQDSETIAFTNKYEAEGEITFAGTKAIDGRAMTANDVFTFEIKEGEKVIATVQNDATGKIAYPTIKYTLADVGTHTYTVKETSTNGNGITVDTKSYTVTVTVADKGDGTLSVTASDNAAELDFINKYEAEGEITFAGSKTIDGREMTTDDVFTFEVKEGNTVIATVENDVTGAIAYPTIKYTLADVGTHTYTVKETSKSGNGITVDETEYTVTVTVADKGDGTLNVTASNNAQTLSFVNTYEAKGSVEFGGWKALLGREFQAGDTFTFELTDADGTVIDTVTINPTSGTTANFAFDAITYDLEDIGEHTYTYKVKEQTGDLEGMTYDTTVHTVTVTVTDAGDGTLKIEASQDTTKLNFTNTYAAEGSVQFGGTKTLTGKAIAAGEFTFALMDAEGKTIETVTNAANGSFAFSPIAYELTDAGKPFTYTVKEVAGNNAGITYDEKVYTVTVEVTDNGDGTLTATASENATKLNFTNAYAAEGEITFAGVKTIEGREMTKDDMFTFEVKEGNDVLALVTNDATGKIAYPTIAYTQADVGKHTYKVRETNTDGDGMTVDTTVYTVTVEVVDNGDGTLTVTASDNADELNFKNTYAAEGEITFAGTKAIDGRAMTADDVFTFEIKEGEKVIATVQNDATGKIAYPMIEYTLDDVGTHTYTVKEAAGNKTGITYDATVYTVTVEVTDNGDGTLSATASKNATELDFVNTYAAEGSVQFRGMKTLTGKALAADDFSFELIDAEGKVIEKAKNAADGKFAFSAIKYELADAGKTFTYTVKEVNDGKAGITYDNTVYTVTVEVVDNGDGTLSATASDNADELNFKNTYAAEGEITFAGTKTIDGRELTANDKFTFIVMEGENEIATVQNDATGKIAYPTIEYTLKDVGEHTYTVKETSTDGEGITVDTTEYTVTVTVSDNGDGTLSVTASDNAAELDFINKYAAEGEITFAGTKTIDGRELTANDKFTFIVMEGENEIATVQNDATGKIAYPTIEYTLDDVGEHTYTVKETSINGNSITVDTTVYTVTVTVADNGDGMLSVTASENAEALNFTNTYTAAGEIELEGTKTLVGRELAAGEFEFELVNEAGETVATATNDAEGKIVFTKLTYKIEDIGKTYTYTAKEINGSLPGVTYDAAPITVKVEITDNGDGTLNVVKTTDTPEIAFTNTYSAEGTILLAGTKSLSGRALKAGEFSFELIDADGNVLQTVTNNAKGAFAFEEIKYELADAGKTYTYTVKEKAGELPGVTYDENVITVEVEVKDVGGKLTATLTENSEAIAFTNKYEAEGEITFAGVKTIEGREMTKDDMFTFEVKEGNDVLALVTNDATGKIAYPTIKYTLNDVGTHTYTVRETNTDGDGMTVDTTVYTVTVEVTDNGDGTLSATASENATELNFKNTYAAEGSVQFSGTKTLTGKALAAGEFTFVLVDEAGKTIETVKNAADGSFAFSAIEYTLADVGTHTYTVKEAAGNKTGITYDDTVYTVTVEVVDNGDGTLSVTASDNAAELDFVNTYAAEGSVQFGGTKTLTGKALAADDFSFELIDSEGKVIENVTNAANGKFAFSAIKYELADAGKTFTYTVKEVNDGKSGITYDNTVYAVTVEVADNGDGKLTVTASDNATELDFVNTYAAEGTVQFSGTKTLTGKALAADDFSFELIDSEGKVIESVKNAADGKFAFSAIKYELADAGKTFTYTVKEVNDGKAGITYDATVYTVTVEVTDNGDGTLSATASKNATELDFVNTYAAEGTVQFSGTKTLTGKALAADDFSFELIDSEGKVIESVKNAADGKFAFSAIKYELADAGKTFTYTVKEVNDGKAGITYDAAVYTVTVEVTDKGDGTLSVTASKNATELNFVNTYAAEGEITFAGTKTIDGRELTADDVFTFEIKEGEKVIATVQNDATGKIAYPTIAYTLADVGTHTYTVKETSKGGNGITVDTTEYTVTVEVADNGDGTVKVTASDNATKLDFVNKYTAVAQLRLNAVKTVDGAEPTEDQVFDFVLKGEDLELKAQNVKGSIEFGTIYFDLEDAGKTFTYTIEETTESSLLMITDKSVYKATVTVTDNGDGNLKLETVITRDGEPVNGVIFDNKQIGTLTISKKVEGKKTDEAFNMIVTLYDAEGNELTGEYDYTGNVTGKITSGGTIALADGQSVTIQGLPEGAKYIVEEDVSGVYTTTVNGAAGTKTEGAVNGDTARVDFVNTMETTTFSVTKVWEGTDLGAISLILYANGEEIVPQPEVVRAGSLYTYYDLPKYDEDGNEIVYTAKERGIEGYIRIYKNVAPYEDVTKVLHDGATVINRAEPKLSFKVQKLWTGMAEGEELPAITLTLLCNGEVTDVPTPKPDSDGWYKYYDLPETVNGQPAVYTVVEEPMDGFAATYQLRSGEEADYAENGGTITNAKIPQTGDTTSLALWTTLMAGASLALMAMLLRRKKAH